MGGNQDVMRGFVRQEINRFFSSYDGWKIVPGATMKGYDQVFSVVRSKMGEKETVSIFVSFEPKVSAEMFRAAAYIVPQNADTAGIPAGSKVLYMKSFSFQNGVLTWEKNPARRPVVGKETPVAA